MNEDLVFIISDDEDCQLSKDIDQIIEKEKKNSTPKKPENPINIGNNKPQKRHSTGTK